MHPSGYIQTYNNVGTALVLEIKYSEILFQVLIKLIEKLSETRLTKMKVECLL